MSKIKSLNEKLSHIFTPVDSFESDLPTEREVICRYIAIFDVDQKIGQDQKSYHISEVEKSAISKLAKEVIEIWKKHGISKSQRSVEDCLRQTFIPRFRNVFVKSPPKSEKLVAKKIGEFSEVFMLKTESPAKRIREQSLNDPIGKNCVLKNMISLLLGKLWIGFAIAQNFV